MGEPRAPAVGGEAALGHQPFALQIENLLEFNERVAGAINFLRCIGWNSRRLRNAEGSPVILPGGCLITGGNPAVSLHDEAAQRTRLELEQTIDGGFLGRRILQRTADDG